MSKSDLIDLTVSQVHETPAAVLIHDGDNEVWLPKSKIEVDDTGKRDEKRRKIVVVTLPERLALEKGLI